MKTRKFLTLLMLLLTLLIFLPERPYAQTAGGSAVLCCCNSSIEFMTLKDCGNVEIVNLCKISSNKSRVDVIIDGVVDSKQINYNSSITIQPPRDGKTHYVKIVHIEKGTNGKNCGSRGPGDGDVRVIIPAMVANIAYRGMPAENSCSVCGANFLPKVQ